MRSVSGNNLVSRNGNSSEEKLAGIRVDRIAGELVFTIANTLGWMTAGAMLSPTTEKAKSLGAGLGAVAGVVSGVGLVIAKARGDAGNVEGNRKVSAITLAKGAVLGAGFGAAIAGVYEDPLIVIVGITAGTVLGVGTVYLSRCATSCKSTGNANPLRESLNQV